MTTDNAPALLYNPFDPAFRHDPYTVYARLREEAPVYETPFGFTVFSTYAHCAAILRHPLASSDASKSDAAGTFAEQHGLDPDTEMVDARPFLFMDPPDHTRLRGLVTKAFTPRVIEGLRPRVQQIVDGILDAMRGRREMDVIAGLAYPLPVTIISEMLGVPPEDHTQFSAWSAELARGLDPDLVLPPEVIARRQKAADEFTEYFRGLIARRRAAPRNDLVSALIAAEEQGQTLTEEELLSTCILLLIAGHETTVNLIGNGMFALLRNPGQLQMLRDDPSLIRTAVEELLRYDAPVQLTGRNALEDIDLGDAVLRKGQQSVLLLGSANRDPAHFPDAGRLDITREENRHLAFGMGIHFCLGAPLARVEGQIAILAMTQRLDRPRLVQEAPEYKENVTLRGLAALPVAFDAVR